MTQYLHRSWGTEDGLPQISAESIAQTPDGYIWIATADGLARFDGVAFTVYDKGNTPQLRDSSITALRTDTKGTLWIGTGVGIVTYRDGQFHALGAGDGVQKGPVYALYEAHDGALWIGGRGVVFEQRNGKFRPHELPVHDDVLSFGEAEGALWAAAYGGLIRLGATTTVFKKDHGLPDNNVLSLAADGDDLWIGTARGVVRRRNGGFRNDVPERLRHEEVWSILRDRDGTLWFGTRQHGLLRLHAGAVDAYTSKEGLSNDYVVSLLQDRDGGLWAGTQLGGVNEFHDGPFATFSATDGLKSDIVWSIHGDRAGIWIGTDKGLNLLAGGRVQPLSLPESLNTRTVSSIARSADDTLWVGSWDRGLFRLHEGRWSSFTTRDGLADDFVASLLVDGPTVWVGTAHGLSRIDAGRIKNVGADEGLPPRYISCIQRDRRGRLWVGTDAGLYRRAGERFVLETHVPMKATFCIHEDELGVIWVGTREGLVSILPGGDVRLPDSRAEVLQQRFFQIEQDGTGDFWMSCARGVLHMPRLALAGRAGEAQLFGSGDGMSGEPTSGIQPSSSLAPDGSIWFPTIRGAVRLDPEAAKRGSVPPNVTIERVIVDGRDQSSRAPLDLGPGTEKLEFHYTAPWFMAPARLRFRYRLAGYDSTWIEAGTRRVAYYTHIPPGRYSFRVMASDGSGTWRAKEAQTTLVLRPRFTETGWFDLVTAVLAALAATWIYVARVRRIRKQHVAVLAERTRIAREFHDTLAQSLVALSQQIHIGLRAIDDGNSESGRQALDAAGNLARQSLTDTRRSLLDLRPEVLERAGLNAAIDVIAAQARSTGALEVTTAIAGAPRPLDRRVEQNMLRIAQEAVANAVKHSGAKSLSISLRFESQTVELSVTDDGIGAPSRTDSGPLQLGLLGVQERAREIDGHLTVSGAAGKGTAVRLVVHNPYVRDRARFVSRIAAWSHR